MKAQWVNLILHTGALIRKKKEALPLTHSWQSVFSVISLVFLEIFLAIISLPLYFVQRNVNDDGSGRQYHIRRVITLSILVVIGIIWLLKLVLALFAISVWNHLPEYQVEDIGIQTQRPITHEEVFTINQAEIDPALPSATIETVNRYRGGVLEIEGTATADSQVLVYVSRTDRAGQPGQEDITVFTTDASNEGAWLLHLNDQPRFHLRAGDYATQALAYDESRGVKSPTGQGVAFTIERDPVTPLGLIGASDRVLNLTVFVILALGLIITLLIA